MLYILHLLIPYRRTALCVPNKKLHDRANLQGYTPQIYLACDTCLTFINESYLNTIYYESISH